MRGTYRAWVLTVYKGPSCQICKRDDVKKIDADFGAGLAETARKYGVDGQALKRHRGHVAQEVLLGKRADPRGKEMGKVAPPPPPKPRPAALPPGELDAKVIATETLRGLRDQLAEAENSGERVKISTAIVATTKLLAKLNGQLEITEGQIIKSRPFGRVMAAIEEVLKKYPAAAKEVAEALKKEAGL